MSNPLSRLREFLFPADRLPLANFPWNRNVLSTLGIFVVAFVLIIFGPILVILPLMGLKDFAPAAFAALKSDKLMFMSVLQLLTYVTGFGAAVWFFKSRFPKGTSLTKLVSMNLDSVKGNWLKLLVPAICFLVAADVITSLVYSVFHLPAPYSPAGDFGSQLSGASFLLFGFITVVLAPIFEELVFRGFMFNMLRACFKGNWTGDLAAALISGAIFAAGHGTLTGFPGLFIVGVGLALMYRRSGSLYGSMTMHALNNLMATIALYLSMHH